MVHQSDFVKESPSLILTIHLANGSKCTQCKGSDHVQNWQMDSLHKKSQKHNIIAPRPTRIKLDCRRINSKKAQPCLFIIRFLNAPRRLQQCHGELKGPVMPSETSLTKRSLIHLHQVANSTFLEPSDHSTSSQAKISSMGFFLPLFCLSSLCLLIWILRNMLLRFWFWTYHRNVCLNLLFTFFT